VRGEANVSVGETGDGREKKENGKHGKKGKMRESGHFCFGEERDVDKYNHGITILSCGVYALSLRQVYLSKHFLILFLF
jgi:hypothetical protein